jgi:stage II sporulation protein D
MVCLAAGLGVGLLVTLLVRPPASDPALTQENRRLSDELASLRQELDAFRDKLANELRRALPDEDPAPAETGPRLAVPIPALSSDEPAVRIALLRTQKDLVMVGDELFLEHTNGVTTPMRGRATARVNKNGVFVEGVGTAAPGLKVVNRLGPIKIGDREYPGTLELHTEEGRLLVVNELPLERYLAGVVGSEVPNSWSVEAKKAQAVAARTYALMKRADADRAWHLEATVNDQVYNGKPVDGATRAAVTATHGEVLTRDGYLVSAFYHSTCGGMTELPKDVWPEQPSHGNTAVVCGHCERSPHHTWKVDISPEQLLSAAGRAGHEATQVKGLHVRSRSTSERITGIDLVTDRGTVTWSGQRFRELLGYGKVKGTRFEVSVHGNAFRLTGRGFGHGVGMCQWGAQGMAAAGDGYRAILGLYYPSSKIERIY